MRKDTWLATALIVVMCALVVWLAWGGRTSADRLAARGWELFTLPGCGACTQQLRLLGGAMTYRPTYVCGRAPPGRREQECPGVYPTWRNAATGEVRTGVQDAAALREMMA